MHVPIRPFRAIGVGITAALVGSLVAAPATAAPSTDPTMFCDLPGQELAISPAADLVPGEAVTWDSTVSGTTPTTFSGEFVGTVDNGLGDDANGNPRDLLLVRLAGPIVDGSATSLPTGVWAGASGSPVYDQNGALIGAVSYSFSSEADNVAGVTPATAMKSIGDLPSRVTLSTAERQGVARSIGGSVPSTMSPLRTVRVGSTAANRMFDAATQQLERRVPGYTPISTQSRSGGTGTGTLEDLPIVSGGNVVVSYAYGAALDATVGTVTAVCGDQIWAYGHPNTGNSRLISSFHGASTARIVPSAGESYKQVAQIGAPKGVITEDRSAGLRGTLGVAAATVPITTTVSVGGHRRTVVTHASAKEDIAPAAMVQLGTEAMRVLDNASAGSATVRWSIDYRRANGRTGTLTNTNKYADELVFPMLVGSEVMQDIAALQMNGLETVRITAVRISAEMTPDYLTSRLTGVQLRKGGKWVGVRNGATVAVARGKSYTFRAVMRPAPNADGATQYQTFTVKVPKSLKRSVSVRLDGTPPEQFPDFLFADPTSVEELLSILDNNARADRFTLTRSYQSASGVRKFSVGTRTTATALDGGRFAMTLQAAKLTKR